jgi:hypothetical protein
VAIAGGSTAFPLQHNGEPTPADWGATAKSPVSRTSCCARAPVCTPSPPQAGVGLGVEERARYERDLAAARSGLMQRA